MARPDLNRNVISLMIQMKLLFEKHGPSDCLCAMEINIANMINDDRTDTVEVVRDIEWIQKYLSRKVGRSFADLEPKVAKAAEEMFDKIREGGSVSDLISEFENMAIKEKKRPGSVPDKKDSN